VRVEGQVTTEEPLAGRAAARLLKNSKELWRAEPGAVDKPTNHDLSIEVAQGDTVNFVAGLREAGSNTGKLFWDPVITYTRSEPAVYRPNPPGDENLALGKYARSKMLSFGAQPFNAVDGDAKSAFAIYPDDRITSGDDWLQVDLDRPQTIDRYIVVSTPPVEGWRPANFTLQKSDDGFTWTDVDRVTGNREERFERKVPAFTARYVRLYLPQGKPFSINEFGLYHGGDAANTSPEKQGQQPTP
jgi:hypothetical protein